MSRDSVVVGIGGNVYNWLSYAFPRIPYHSRFENGLDFAAGVGNVPLVYHITENRHNIKVVGGVKVVIGGDKAHVVLVKGTLQKPYFNHITPDSALVFDDNRCHVPRPDFV